MAHLLHALIIYNIVSWKCTCEFLYLEDVWNLMLALLLCAFSIEEIGCKRLSQKYTYERVVYGSSGEATELVELGHKVTNDPFIFTYTTTTHNLNAGDHVVAWHYVIGWNGGITAGHWTCTDCIGANSTPNQTTVAKGNQCQRATAAWARTFYLLYSNNLSLVC